MLSNFQKISLIWMLLIISGCVSDSGVKLKDVENYLTEIESKVKTTGPETLRLAETKITVSQPFPIVYKATLNVLSHLDNTAMLTPISQVPQGEEEARIIYADREPIFYDKKPINEPASKSTYAGTLVNPFSTSKSSYTEDLRIYVSVFIESQGPNITTVYFYSHHKLCHKIADNLNTVVDTNMHHRGNVFVYRLQTQLTSHEKWQWISDR